MRGSIPKGRSGGGNSPSTLKPNWCWTFEADSDIDCWEKSDNDTPANGNILWLKIQLYGALWWRKVKDERFWFIDFTGWGQKKSLTTWIKHKKWFCGAPTTQDLHKKRFIYCKRRRNKKKTRNTNPYWPFQDCQWPLHPWRISRVTPGFQIKWIKLWLWNELLCRASKPSAHPGGL